MSVNNENGGHVLAWESGMFPDDSVREQNLKRVTDYLTHEKYEYIGILDLNTEIIEFITRKNGLDFPPCGKSISYKKLTGFLCENLVHADDREDYTRGADIENVKAHLETTGRYAFTFLRENSFSTGTHNGNESDTHKDTYNTIESTAQNESQKAGVSRSTTATVHQVQYDWFNRKAGLALVLNLDISPYLDPGSTLPRISNRGSRGQLEGRVLLVDDDLTSAIIEERTLESFGLTADLVHDGIQAVYHFRDSAPQEYDLILMEVEMPIMNGYEAAEIIRHLDRPGAEAIPIIAMTSDHMQETAERCARVGIDRIIPKPLDRPALFEVLRAILE